MSHPALRTVAAAAFAVGAFVVSPAAAAAQRAPAARPASAPAAIRVDQVMAPWELEATGIARLSAAERRAFEAWLNRYATALRAGRGAPMGAGPAAASPSTGPAAMDTIRPAPGSQPAPAGRPAPERPARIAVSLDPAPSALEIAAVYDDGDVIATADGSLWETYLPDRFNAGAWQPGQSVIVRANLLPPQLSGVPFDVVLLNGETRTRAAARYAGRQRVDPAAGSAASGAAPGVR